MVFQGVSEDVCFVDRVDNDVGVQAQISMTETRGTLTDVHGIEPVTAFSSRNLRSDEEFKSWLGVTQGFFALLCDLIKLPNQKTADVENFLLVSLIKLKTNLSYSSIASLFCINHLTASKMFTETLSLLHRYAKDLLIWFPKEVISARMPQSFKKLYPNCRVVIDATEVECERPKTVQKQVQLYSNYKSKHTVKFLVGIAPSGEFTFLSKAYGGRVTDTFLTVQSGLLNLIEPGDEVLADKGFPQIEPDLNNVGAFLVMPPFKRGTRQFSDFENTEGYKCASVRIHVERAIRRLKYFEILNFLSNDLLFHIDKIIVVVAFLCNSMSDLIKKS